MARLSARFAEDIANVLDKAGYEYVMEPRMRGATPDFLVATASGGKVILEAKAWEPTKLNLARARKEAEFYSGMAHRAFVVLRMLFSRMRTTRSLACTTWSLGWVSRLRSAVKGLFRRREDQFLQ
jgi:hypothetical protein